MNNALIYKFFTSLRSCNNPEENLKKESIVAEFFDFAKREKGYDRDCFVQEYDEIGADILDGKTLEDFIYSEYLHFHSDVLLEYQYTKGFLKEALAYLIQAKTECIKVRTDIKERKTIGKEFDKYTDDKYEYYIEYIVKRIKLIETELDEANLIKRALEMAQTPSWLDWQKMSLFSFSKAVDYAMLNGQDYIWFAMLPVREMREMRRLRKEDHEQYVEAFAKVIDKYSIVKELVRICEENYYLNKRLNIIRSATGLFYREEYEAFAYLMAPQTEGMFGDYLNICNVSFNDKGGMKEKVEKIRNNTPVGKGAFLEYAYFRYDLPVLRNPMAHGAIVGAGRETAFEILMDVYWVAKNIDSKENYYKKWIEFLRGFSSVDCCRTLILKQFRSDNPDTQSYIEALKRWLRGDFGEIIDYYCLLENEGILRECLNSVELYDAIWSSIPLQSEDKKQCTNGMRVMKWNDEPLLYKDFVETIKEKDFKIPDGWLSGYYSFIEAIRRNKENVYLSIRNY